MTLGAAGIIPTMKDGGSDCHLCGGRDGEGPDYTILAAGFGYGRRVLR